MKRLRAEYRYEKTEIRWVVIDPKANPILARTMKQTGATRWHKFRVDGQNTPEKGTLS